MKRPPILSALLSLAFLAPAHAADDLPTEINSTYLPSERLYLDLHAHPELSGHETQTASKLADGLRSLGFKVTTAVGRTGVVGILTNGPPTVLLRTELDALPVGYAAGTSRWRCTKNRACRRDSSATARVRSLAIPIP